MPVRIAGSLSLLCFAVCLIAGGFGTDNPFGTVVWRALVAMVFTFLVGLIVGAMAAKMLEENLAAEEQRLSEQREARIRTLSERDSVLEVGAAEPAGTTSHNG